MESIVYEELYKNLLLFLEYRNYSNVPSYDDTVTAFTRKISEDTDYIFYVDNGSKESVKVAFYTIPKMGKTVNNFKPVLKSIKKEKLTNFIIISSTVPSKDVKKAIKTLQMSTSTKIEVVPYLWLGMNYPNHFEAPKYNIIPRDQIQAVLDDSRISSVSDLPVTYLDDSVYCAWLGAVQGDVIKIVYTSETAPKNVKYSYVKSG